VNDLPKEIYFSELIGSNGVNCLDYKNFDDSEKYIRGDIHEALEQRVGELEDWKKITDTAGKKLAEDNIRLRKALEDIVKTGNNKNLTDQQQRLQMYELARAEVYISLPTEAEEEVWEMPLSYAHQSHVKV